MAKPEGFNNRGLGGLTLQNDKSATDIHGLDTLRMVELFKGFGFSCKPSSQMRGISGTLHDFDFICVSHETGEKLVVQSLLHLSQQLEKLDIEVVKLRLSTYDCSPDACLVVTDCLPDKVKQLASQYKLTIIDKCSGDSPYDQIESLLRLRA